MKIIRPTPRWSEITIDADKDMRGKSLTNLNDVEYKRLITETDYVIQKSPDRPQIRIITLFGYLDIGASNKYNVHFYTDKSGFYFDKEIRANENVRPVFDNQKDLGIRNMRWNDGWFAGSLALGVIKNIGDTLTVDVIYDDAYTEVASYLDETNTDTLSAWVDDWVIGTLSTYTENGIITGIKLQFEYNNYDDTDNWSYRLLEDGVEVMSFTLTANSSGTLSGEYNTLKTSADYKTQIYSTSWQSENWKIRNRYLYFRKRYLGIKSGS